MKIYFGKHQGEEVTDLPTSYLKWLVDGCDQQPPLSRSDGPEERKRKREQWKNLLSEVEDELDQRDEE